MADVIKKTNEPSANKTPFLTAETAYDAYDESRKWLRVYFEPLDEYERIARNKPSPRIDPSLPRITDGTTAAIIQEQPKRIIQQLATGKVSSPDYPEYAPVADIVLVERLIPMYNRMGDALQKDWNMLGKAMTYGMSTSYTFFTSTNGVLHTDYSIPYVKDVLTEKGKVYAPDSNITFMRSWYQKRDLKAIIDREKAFMSQDPKYESGWDLKLLSAFMETSPSTKPAENMTPSEKEKGDGYSGGYEVIHAFQKGKGAEFYSFSPHFENGKNLRTKVNKDPRGHMPLDFLYCNIDLSNPIGRGSVELSGGVQNLMDQQLQMFQFMNTMEQGPPLQVWGSVNKSSLKFRPNAIWDMGSNPNNKVEAYQASNVFTSNFTANAQYLQSKIYNLNNSQDTSIPAANNNVGQSKTHAGVQASQERLGVSDNYLRKQYESWRGKQSESSLNIYFSEMSVKDTIDLGKQQIAELESTKAAQFIKNGKLNINYGDINNCVFRFKVDAGSSKTSEDQEQLQRLEELVKEVESNPLIINYYLAQSGKKINLGEVYAQRFKRLGLENLDSILTEMSAEEAQAAKQAPFPIIDKPQFRIQSADLSPAALTEVLKLGGVNIPNDPQAAQAFSAPSNQAQLDYQVEMTKAQGAQASANQPAAPSGPTPDELALKHRELDIKQQHADQGATKQALDIQNAAHSQTMDMHNAVQTAMTPDASSAGQNLQPNQQAQDVSTVPNTDAPPPTPGQSQPMTAPGPSDPHTPEEQKIVEALLQRGFSEQDVEQALVMLRNGVNPVQIMQALGAKHGKR